jgi:hypothetical protein
MDESQLRRQRRTILAFLYVLFMLLGATEGALSNLPQTKLPPGFAFRVHLLLTIPICLGFMWFCTVDARLAGKSLIQLAKLGIFVFWPAGVPIYLIWARGVRGLGVLLLHGIMLLVVLFCAALAVVWLTYHGDTFLGWSDLAIAGR